MLIHDKDSVELASFHLQNKVASVLPASSPGFKKVRESLGYFYICMSTHNLDVTDCQHSCFASVSVYTLT